MWIGQSVSQSGDAIFAVAIFWVVLTSTGSAFYVGVVSAVIYSSQIVFGTLSGVYIDRLNRRTLLIILNLLQAILTAFVSILYIENALRIEYLLASIFFIFGMAVVIRSSVNALIPTMVSTEDLPASNSLFSLTSSLNSSFNYIIGGLILVVLGAAFSIMYDSLTFVIAGVVASLVRREYGILHKEPPDDLSTKTRFRDEFGEGLRYVKSKKLLLQIALFGVVVNFLGTAAIVLLAPYSRVWLRGGPETYGLILGAFSVGGIFASLAYGKIDLRKRVGKVLLLGVMVAGLAIALMGIATNALVATPLACVFGFSIVFSNLPIQVLMQATIPRKLFGRVFTVITTGGTAIQPFSALIAGSLGTSVSIGLLFVVFGVCVIGASILAYIFLITLRKSEY